MEPFKEWLVSWTGLYVAHVPVAASWTLDLDGVDYRDFGSRPTWLNKGPL